VHLVRVSVDAMSTVVRPSGPLPPRVYWVRRLLLLGVVLGPVWALLAAVGGGDDPASGEPETVEPGAEVTEEPADEASTNAQSAAETRREERKARRERKADRRTPERVQDVSQSLETAAGACDLTLVQVVPHVTEPVYARSEVPMRIGLRTEQATACTLALSPDRLLVAVHSLEDVSIWSSTECPDSVPTRDVVLRPHWTATVDLLWSGTRSGRRCSADDAYAAPGEYVLQVAALTGEPASFEFTLAEPVVVQPGRQEPGQQQPGQQEPGQQELGPHEDEQDDAQTDDEPDGQQVDGEQEAAADERAEDEPDDREREDRPAG
jgi:hypothetical protein